MHMVGDILYKKHWLDPVTVEKFHMMTWYKFVLFCSHFFSKKCEGNKLIIRISGLWFTPHKKVVKKKESSWWKSS